MHIKKIVAGLLLISSTVCAEKRSVPAPIITPQPQDQIIQNSTPQVMLHQIARIITSVLSMVTSSFDKGMIIKISCDIIACIASIIQQIINSGMCKGASEQEIAALVYRKLLEEDTDAMVASYVAKTVYRKRVIFPMRNSVEKKLQGALDR